MRESGTSDGSYLATHVMNYFRSFLRVVGMIAAIIFAIAFCLDGVQDIIIRIGEVLQSAFELIDQIEATIQKARNLNQDTNELNSILAVIFNLPSRFGQ